MTKLQIWVSKRIGMILLRRDKIRWQIIYSTKTPIITTPIHPSKVQTKANIRRNLCGACKRRVLTRGWNQWKTECFTILRPRWLIKAINIRSLSRNWSLILSTQNGTRRQVKRRCEKEKMRRIWLDFQPLKAPNSSLKTKWIKQGQKGVTSLERQVSPRRIWGY